MALPPRSGPPRPPKLESSNLCPLPSLSSVWASLRWKNGATSGRGQAEVQPGHSLGKWPPVRVDLFQLESQVVVDDTGGQSPGWNG